MYNIYYLLHYEYYSIVYRNILTATTAQNYATPSSPQPGIAGQSGRGASVVSLHNFQFNHKMQLIKNQNTSLLYAQLYNHTHYRISYLLKKNILLWFNLILSNSSFLFRVFCFAFFNFTNRRTP